VSVHISPVVLHIRGYPNHVDVRKHLWAMSEAYFYHIVVLVNDVGIARLEGLDGMVSHYDRRQIVVKLRDYGVRRAEWRHNGIEKHYNLVPGG